ncbi:CidB/LrgB family autolysis modulator [Bacillus sp. V5-8f]|nr:CidB/LrgB family autolysis modulator [Bacillus sp. V5-8f]
MLAKRAYKKWSFPFLHPLLIGPLAIILLISAAKVPASEYLEGSKWISHLLGPATVAFAVPIYKHMHLLKKYSKNILLSITTGTLVAIFSSFVLSLFMHLSPDLVVSILPRSITTPIAIEVSREIGGLPALTTVFVIFTGVIGGIIGPSAIKWLSITSPVARGLALGMGAHGVGTNKAREYGEQEATFSTLAMILAAWITMFWGNSLIPLMTRMIPQM